MPWYFYLLDFVAGTFLTNGVPHFVHGVGGAPFQSPFASPPGVGESSPVVNAVWGFGNFVAGALLLHYFWPRGGTAWAGWIAFGFGVLAMAVQAASHFGKVRAKRPLTDARPGLG